MCSQLDSHVVVLRKEPLCALYRGLKEHETRCGRCAEEKILPQSAFEPQVLEPIIIVQTGSVVTLLTSIREELGSNLERDTG
jgi:hypothetical protein